MEPFIGQIMQVGFNFAPVQWAVCGGQLLPISQNTALFSLLGTNFGGNGQTTFALPNLQGRVIIGAGQSTGSVFQIGEVGGQESVTIAQTEMPAHTHGATFTPSGGGSVSVTVNAVQTAATTSQPDAGSLLATLAPPRGGTVGAVYVPAGTAGTQVALGGVSASGGGGGGTVTVAPTGGSQPTSILPPFQSVLQIISLAGIFPSRS